MADTALLSTRTDRFRLLRKQDIRDRRTGWNPNESQQQTFVPNQIGGLGCPARQSGSICDYRMQPTRNEIIASRSTIEWRERNSHWRSFSEQRTQPVGDNGFKRFQNYTSAGDRRYLFESEGSMSLDCIKRLWLVGWVSEAKGCKLFFKRPPIKKTWFKNSGSHGLSAFEEWGM